MSVDIDSIVSPQDLVVLSSGFNRAGPVRQRRLRMERVVLPFEVT
jgi:hypothetical protein